MKHDEAKRLIRDTFENPFEKNRFARFASELLNSLKPTPKTRQAGNLLPDAYKEKVQAMERIGKYSDPEGMTIDVLAVKLAKPSSVWNARTMQRNFISRYLNGSRGGQLKDAALVAFYADDCDEWRFSLIRMEYAFDEKKKKITQEFTPARRSSFIVGPSENSHTAQKQLLPILEDETSDPSLCQFESAFSVEKVTKRFFEEYRELFFRVKEALDNLVSSDRIIKKDFTEKNIDTSDFAKKLLGQVVFLYYLQKKGWFGVQRGKEWGSGSKNFLRELFKEEHGDYDNFFNNILEPLFYEALRLERPKDYYDKFHCRIPFLNGGLFDPLNDYDWQDTDILLPDDIFSNDRKSKEGDIGDGILDIFDRYNFTVKEDEPLEKEVAVDPEMLGKVFENLLEVKDRKSKGTYYTPREIVHYMCQESLINYLDSSINEGVSSFQAVGSEQSDLFGNKVRKSQLKMEVENKKITVPKEDIEKLVKYGETWVEHETMHIEKKSQDKKYRGKYDKPKLPESVRKNAKLIDEKLAEIRVCDPAVGSGAFPVGMMNEIVRTRNALTPHIGKDGERTPYNFKRHAIQNCLYGVDIDLGAVEIAKLRLWLSLVVDEEERETIQPLPNLDYKIVQGNSLLGFPYIPQGLEAIEKLKLKFFEETRPKIKEQLRNDIDEAIHNLLANTKRTLGYKVNFDFKIFFSEVFHEKDGFDVVIANPPYVRADSGPEYLAFRKNLEESKTYKTLYEKWDLMVPFIEKGLTITNLNGDLVYIVSNSICTSKYALKLLDLIQEAYFTRSIDYFEDIHVFEAGVIPVVLHIGKAYNDSDTKKIIRRGSFANIVSNSIIPMEEFKALGRDAFRKDYKPMALEVQNISLGDICYLSVGMVLNADEKLAKGEFKIDDLISDTPTSTNTRRYIEAKDIENWVIKRVRYLEWGTDRCPAKIRRKTFPELYDLPKLMVGSLTGGIFDDQKLCTHHGIVIFVRFFDLKKIDNRSIQMSIRKFNQFSRGELEKMSEKFDLKYLLAILNSSFSCKYLNNIRRHRLENYFYPDDFRKLPIADVSLKKQAPLINLVNSILAITKDKDYLQSPEKRARVQAYEKQIDQLVYKLYNLTEHE